MKEKSLNLIYFIAIGFLVSILVIAFYIIRPNMAVWIDNKIYDIYLQSDKKNEISNQVVIVDIDEKSLESIGQWPWPRYLNAILLENIINSGAASVGFDILMSEDDRSSPFHIEQNLNRYFGIDLKMEGLSEHLYDNDALFGSILAQTNSVLGMYLNFGKDEKITVVPKSASVALLESANAKKLEDELLVAKSVTVPVEKLLKDTSVGYINAMADSDGVIRKIPLVMGLEVDNTTKIYPNLALMSLLKAYGTNTIVLKTNENGIEGVKIADTIVPLESDGSFFVRFKGGKGVYEYISASDIVQNRHDPKSLKDKVVFVGSSATGLLDIRINPFETHYPGVEVHASIVDNILTNHFISVPTFTPGFQVLLVLLFGLLLAYLFSKIPAYLIITFATILLVGFWYIGQHLFVEGFYISPLYIFLLIAIESIAILSVQFIYESMQKREIKGAFSRYVSPVVVSQIAASGIDIFKGEQKDVTIMFTDIRGFTSLSEKLQPEEIVQILNDYFTAMTSLIKKNNGTVDKFIGDAIMAFWNAPLDVENHQKLALDTAMQMQDELAKLNISLEQKYGVTLNMGAGVHSGTAYVGNMGSLELLDYTIIGDNVNLASRIEGLCSKYGLTTIVSEQTIQNCKDTYHFLLIDKITVKGKKEPVSVYYPLKNSIAEDRKEEFIEYNNAHDLYLKGEFKKAKTIFEKLQNENSLSDTTKLYSTYLKRCEQLAINSPKNWDGVWAYETK